MSRNIQQEGGEYLYSTENLVRVNTSGVPVSGPKSVWPHTVFGELIQRQISSHSIHSNGISRPNPSRTIASRGYPHTSNMGSCPFHAIHPAGQFPTTHL